ncbi:polysialyltransferase family glycosyltransferase [Flavobacterium sp. KS-LB2]|uniref:polysialyltransferase family glycosyltransferase n=1 Tax=Flavobacterium sp. KS-LB2 TaxID=3120525 RepID=UPI0030D353EE
MKVIKNVYVVLTEYQFLQAVNIATGVYNTESYINTIYIIRNGTRLQGLDTTKITVLNNITTHVIDNRTTKDIATIILREKPNHFLFFQAINAVNIYIAYKLSKKGVEISLGPDGYSAYAKFNKKYHFLSVIRDSIKENKILVENKLFVPFLRFDYYTYGCHKFINTLWITHPEQYVHSAKNKPNVIKLPEFNTDCISFIAHCFNYYDDFPIENVIYYFNQPLWENLYNTDFEFLEAVLNQFPQKKIAVKLHPLTTKTNKQKYQNNDRIILIESMVPAEVLLIKLKNCIVFSGWSTVLITENRHCNYYFNYPIFKKTNDFIINQLEIPALNHIKMITNPSEMKFPNE